MEIERKFTITGLPDDLEQHTCLIIEQAYLNTDPVLRIRRQNDDYYLTYKGKGLLAREEYNLPLNKEAYEHLRTKADGNIISERKQSVAQLYPNGVNIVGASKKVFGGLEIFGKGTYLVEFTTDDTSAKTATVTIGSVTETAAIENGIGVCEIELTDSAIGSMSADTTISISGTAEKITLKKVMD